MIPIIFCGNKKIFKGIYLCSISIARRTKSTLEIHIFTMNYLKTDENNLMINNEQCLKLEQDIKSFNQNNKVILHDLSKEFTRDFFHSVNVKNEYTPYAFLRLYADEVINEEKAIYLDADTMCNRDINELFNIDINDYEYAACLDYMGRFWVDRKYINSGVILFNLNKIRNTRLLANCRRLLVDHKYKMPDQTALFLLGKKVLILPRKFNEQRKVKEDTVIKHFNKGVKYFPFIYVYNIKQWEIEKVHKKLKIHSFDIDYEFYKNNFID